MKQGIRKRDAGEWIGKRGGELSKWRLDGRRLGRVKTEGRDVRGKKRVEFKYE